MKDGTFDGLVRPMIEMDNALAHAIIPLPDARHLETRFVDEADNVCRGAMRTRKQTATISVARLTDPSSIKTRKTSLPHTPNERKLTFAALNIHVSFNKKSVFCTEFRR